MTFEEMAWEFAEVFDDLDVDNINLMLARNVPIETLGFINEYATTFGESEKLETGVQQRLPNLMLMGYLLRVLEERLDPERKPV